MFDNDGDLDLAITGEDGFENRHSDLFRTDVLLDSVAFALSGSFPDLSFSSTEWGDVDGDGDLDLLLMGQSDDITDGVQQSHTQLWRNDGEGGFEDSQADLIGLNNGDAGFADADGDGDLDLAITGSSATGSTELRVYTNDGASFRGGVLSLSGLESSDLAWGDFDRDGDPDLVAGGISASGVATTLYENADGSFVEVPDVELPGIQGGDLAWGDYDNDQDLDLIIAGSDGFSQLLQVHENTIGQSDAASAFELVSLEALQGVQFSSVSMADIEGDGDLDLVSAGRTATGGVSSAVNDNLAQRFNANLPPQTPSSLAADDADDTVTLSWGAASDDGAPPPASLTYNVRVGTTSEGHEVISSASKRL